MPLDRVPNQRAIVDRRELAEAIAAEVAEHGGRARPKIVALLREVLAEGRAELARRLAEHPSAGHDCARGHAFLVDQLIRLIHDHVVEDIYPSGNRSTGERLAIMAVGGYGRAEMAPHSDVDVAFLTPAKATAWCEQTIEAMLYFLWDLGLKVGHSTRSPDDVVRMGRADLTIRTALLEGRYVWGDEALYDEVRRRFRAEVIAGTERQFVAEKLAERNERHKRVGDSRYVVEPNVKEGKGGLRDLHTLYWIGKYIHRVRSAAELVDVGLFTPAEYRAFRRADDFFLAVRCHLHLITGRAEDRLTFDLQREVAARMQFAERPGKSAVERFMQYYFLNAKKVGALTGVFLAQLDEQFARDKRGWFSGFRLRGRKIGDFPVVNGKLSAPGDAFFAEDPVRLIELFVLADREGIEVHPDAMRLANQNVRLIDAGVRRDKRANALFLELLTSRHDPETALRWMNEAGVFGRFVPDFGRVNAQMQFDMYHHYTVDEHTIRAIGLLNRIEKGELTADHPRATRLIHEIASRRAIYVAVLLHDIAKGRGGDHSVLGGEVAEQLCPRFGLDEGETALVAWLVRAHLLMSATAFKRDLTDPKTIEDFVSQVQSVERLKNLMILTAVDIRAVGPGTWNSWKGQLLGELSDAATERLRLGHMKHGRKARVEAKKEAVAERLGDRVGLLRLYGDRFDDSYWIAEPDDIIALNLVHYGISHEDKDNLSVHCEVYPARGATLVTVIAADHPGLFYRIAGGIHLAGANIIDARIHTTRSGWAVDNFLVQDPHGRPFSEDAQLRRLETAIADALANRTPLVPQLAKRPLPHSRSIAFDVRPVVTFDNQASGRFTVIEVNARDRAALLNRLSRALFENRLVVNSAHVTNYGERAADTFYVTDLTGGKVTAPSRLKAIEAALLEAASDERQAALENA
jgi:[protein-PII] uridylyltransferase